MRSHILRFLTYVPQIQRCGCIAAKPSDYHRGPLATYSALCISSLVGRRGALSWFHDRPATIFRPSADRRHRFLPQLEADLGASLHQVASSVGLNHMIMACQHPCIPLGEAASHTIDPEVLRHTEAYLLEIARDWLRRMQVEKPSVTCSTFYFYPQKG